MSAKTPPCEGSRIRLRQFEVLLGPYLGKDTRRGEKVRDPIPASPRPKIDPQKV